MFIASDGIAKALSAVVDTAGQPIMQLGAQATLLGYPVYVSDAMPAPAAGARSLAFANLEYAYLIRRVRGIGLVRQVELYSDQGQLGYTFTERCDGKPALLDAGRALVHSAT